jgi:hypothetical protein
MWLPTPSDEAVERFRELYLKETGEELDPPQARESATRFLHLHFITAYCGEYLREEITGVPDPAAKRPGETLSSKKKKRGRPRKPRILDNATRDE